MTSTHVPHPIDEPQASRRARYGYSFALLVLVGSLLLVAIAWDHARQRELKLAAEQFRGIAGQQASLVQLHLNSVEMTLRGGASLFAALDRPTPEQWRGYVDALKLQATFPSLVGVGYAVSLDEHRLVQLGHQSVKLLTAIPAARQLVVEDVLFDVNRFNLLPGRHAGQRKVDDPVER